MKIKPYLIPVFMVMFLFSGACFQIDNGIETVKNTIESKVREDAPCLAQMEAIYHLVFAHYKKRTITSSEVYYRSDIATVFYGYSFDKLKIDVIKKNGRPVLYVALPAPKEIAVDKKVTAVECTHKDYKPVDKQKNVINIDRELNNRLEKLKKKYEQKSLEKTRELSQIYFEALAKRFGLKLEMEYY